MFNILDMDHQEQVVLVEVVLQVDLIVVHPELVQMVVLTLVVAVAVIDMI
jgi:hypothetical protein